MKEIQEILQSFDSAVATGKQTALATVVHVEGSSYRRPGARMLVTETGELTGAISGGCLEGDALRKALLAMSDKTSRLVTYDTSDEDDATIGIGLGCNGIIQVLFEPIDLKDPDNPIQLLKKLNNLRENAVLITLFSLHDKFGYQPGTRLLYFQDGKKSGHLIDEALEKALHLEAMDVLKEKQSLFKTFITGNSSLTAFVEWIRPAISLVIVGAGNDAIPLQQMAEIVGWKVAVVDGRSGYANTTRFGAGCQIVVSRPERALAAIRLDENTVCVLMSHNYNYDLALLQKFIASPSPYIGVLGPRKKLERMFDELEQKGRAVPNEVKKRIFGPAGLDIGAETPEEIALSIMAEIKTRLADKEGPFLKNQVETIHPRSVQEIKKETIS